MGKWFTRLLTFAILLPLTGCPPPDPGLPDDALTPEQAIAADNLPSEALKLDELVLPTGESVTDYLDKSGKPDIAAFLFQKMGAQERRKRIISAMVSKAYALSNRASWQFPSEGADAPAQNGLAYSYGAKNHLIRMKPPAGACTERLYGLDCSGFVYQCATSAGIAIPSGPAALQEQPQTWNDRIPEDWKIRMELITDSGPEAGDIISWTNHIGLIVKKGDGTLWVYQSNGVASADGCTANYGAKRGPRAFSLGGAIGAFGPSYKIIRLVTEISGDWNLYVRCQGQSADALSMLFTIDNRNGGSFVANGNGVDYDGTPFSSVLTGTYNPETNYLEAVLDSFVGVEGAARSDSFGLALDFDETGYFPLVKVVDNGGCYAEARLVNRDAVEGASILPVTAPEDASSLFMGTK